MRVLSLNVQHGGGRRIGKIVDFVRQQQPDLAVLTEYRHNRHGDTLRKAVEAFGFVHHYAPPATALQNTVLIASKEPFNVRDTSALADDARRCVIVELPQLVVAAVYFRSGRGKEPLYKYLTESPARLERALMVGDFNTGRHYVDEVGATFINATDFERLLAIGWTDGFRHLHGDRREYTWRSFRLDHALCSNTLLPDLRAFSYLHQAREEGLSDHSGLIVDLAAAGTA